LSTEGLGGFYFKVVLGRGAWGHFSLQPS